LSLLTGRRSRGGPLRSGVRPELPEIQGHAPRLGRPEDVRIPSGSLHGGPSRPSLLDDPSGIRCAVPGAARGARQQGRLLALPGSKPSVRAGKEQRTFLDGSGSSLPLPSDGRAPDRVTQRSRSRENPRSAARRGCLGVHPSWTKVSLRAVRGASGAIRQRHPTSGIRGDVGSVWQPEATRSVSWHCCAIGQEAPQVLNSSRLKASIVLL